MIIHKTVVLLITFINSINCFYFQKCRRIGSKLQLKSDDGLNLNSNNSTDLEKRIIQLEALLAAQNTQLSQLKKKCETIEESYETLCRLFQDLDLTEKLIPEILPTTTSTNIEGYTESEAEIVTSNLEFMESEIFGSAPATVTEAADSAGAAILAAMLAGKQRMLVDVRDAELSRDPDLLVQFIELAILPVAAGLEGLGEAMERSRVKIVFPTVSQLLQYRKSMALSAPEVVALSTLGFECAEKRDNLVVIIAPSPDDDDGIKFMTELLNPVNPDRRLKQPVVILNYHMCPVSGFISKYTIVYHLRLLSVHYMAGANDDDDVEECKEPVGSLELLTPNQQVESLATVEKVESCTNTTEKLISQQEGVLFPPEDSIDDDDYEGEELLKAAMAHANNLAHSSDSAVHGGVTRAMVIRAYPKPWHVFVDLSPDTEVDFEVAATFDFEPSPDDVNQSIIECIEGSELEDELVASQMQDALESGQLNKVTERLQQFFPEDDESEEEEEEQS